jgi:hypothetical protein
MAIYIHVLAKDAMAFPSAYFRLWSIDMYIESLFYKAMWEWECNSGKLIKILKMKIKYY